MELPVRERPEMPSTFGAMVRALREARRIGFSEMVRRTGLDAGNYSKMERGLMPAPKDISKLAKVQAALELSEDSFEWRELLRLADLSRGDIPRSILTDKQLVGKLPALFRQLDEGPLADTEVEALIQKVVDAHTSEPDGEVAWSK
jgi:transcriptional regulator with XRE-family HTH domain